MTPLPNDRLLALAALAVTAEGRIFVEVLRERLRSHDEGNRVLRGDDLAQSQGRAQEAIELINLITTARSVIDGQRESQQLMQQRIDRHLAHQ